MQQSIIIMELPMIYFINMQSSTQINVLFALWEQIHLQDSKC